MEKIDKTQIFYLTLATSIPTLILSGATTLAQYGAQNGWMSVVFSGVLSALIHYLLLKLSFKFSSNSLVEDCYQLFGKFFGNIIILWYITIFLYDSTFILYEVVYYITYIMSLMNVSVIYIALSILAGYLAYSGFEVLARISKISMIIVIIMLILLMLVILFNGQFINLEHLKPIEFDAVTVFKGGIAPSNWFLLLPSFLVLFKGYYKDKDQAIKYSLLANLFIQIVIVVLFILSIVLFGGELMSKSTFPFYEIAMLTIGGIEVIVFSTWVMGSAVKLGIFYFATNQIFTNWLKLRDKRRFIIPLTILIISSAIFQFRYLLLDVIIPYVVVGEIFLFYLPLPIILTIAYALKLKKS